jgi:serine/threonine-protein kinase
VEVSSGPTIDPGDLEPGLLLTPTLELVRLLGEGGMGSIWVAFDKKLERDVAVKVISPTLMNSLSSIRRFQREARIAARVRHPHVVQMLDFGLIDETIPYLVMELLQGESLEACLEREGVLAPSACALLVDQVAQALHAAHGEGIIHRDIKPANVFLVDSTYDLFAKIVDFGIAKPKTSGETTAVTRAGTLVGTPTYMSPEQLLRAAEPTPHTDLWGLSVVAYECLTGYVPFDADTVAALGMVLGKGDFVAPSAQREGLPAELDAFFARALSLDPDERFQDPLDFAQAFVQAAGGFPTRSSRRRDERERVSKSPALGEARTLTPSSSGHARPSPALSPGRFGKYQLVAELGHGGMADVHLAVAQGPAGFGFSKLMVIKRLRPSLANDREFVGMIIDEARLAARLNHPNVVQTLEAGRVGRHCFIAMEYLDGQPFDRVLNRAHRRDGGLRNDLGYVVVSDMLAGLHHAHELCDYDGEPLKVVHRDVSPHNVFVTYDGQVKVVDFGIARAANRATHTATGVVKGKVFYMAPEQARGDDIDRRADIFSAGVLLWEVAVGRRMWGDKADILVMSQLARGEFPASPKEVDPEVPDAVDAICRRALAREPADRYPSAAAMQTDLDRVVHELRSGAQTARGHASRELGDYVATLFADDRLEIQAKIEQQMKALSEATHPELVEAVQITRNVTPRADQDAPTERHDVEAIHTLEGPGSTRTPALSDASRARSLHRGWWAAAAVVALGALALVVTQRAGSDVPSAPAASATPEGAASDAIPAASASETIRVRIRSRPADAVLVLDGRRLDDNPFDGRFARDDRVHDLVVEAPGHAPEARTVVFDHDHELLIELEPSARAVKGRPPPPSAPSPKGVGVKAKHTIDTADPYGH